MTAMSSIAVQLGAALGAGLMLTAGAAFQIGARPSEAQASQGLSIEVTALAREFKPQPEAEANTVAIRPVADTAPAPEPQGPIETARAAPMPRLAVILDDVADLRTAEQALALEVPVTLAVLPYADDARAIAALAAEREAELFVHLPMEPVGLDDPGPNALRRGLSSSALERRAAWAFDQVPGAIGFNNHMGSGFTTDRAAMDDVFAALAVRQGGLIFVDSLTHPRSVAASAARAAGFETLSRDVFLDHAPDTASISAQLDAALAQAQREGTAIAIAHPRPETFAVLAELAVRAEAAGVEVTGVAALARGEG